MESKTLEQEINKADKTAEMIAIAEKLGLSRQKQLLQNTGNTGWQRFESRAELKAYLEKEHGYLMKKKLWFKVRPTDAEFCDHIHTLDDYPARIPYGALLKLQEIKEARGRLVEGLGHWTLILDENHRAIKSDPFLIVADSLDFRSSFRSGNVGCWLVYGWKDKQDDSVA